ncbi:hypothetical protein HRbin27_02034 [bacterium HR27]|nr:hypothetical protein HRbin27_02034 [bacterium HR27]
MLGDGDLVHLQRGTHGVGWRPADELHDGRRTGEREPAEASCLRDRTVTNIGVGVLWPEPGEVEAARHVGRAGEPAIAEAGDPSTELGAVP